jgi:hypothetical protein
MKLLIANGCSNTAGSDIDPNNLRYCAEKAWPRWVADHFGWDQMNIAQGGSGNEQISRSTIITIANLIEKQNKNPEDIVVTVCWSGFDRYEFWDVKENLHKSFALSSTHTPYVPEPMVKQYIELRSLIEPEYYGNYKNLYYMYTLTKFLESYGIEYYFANCLKSFVRPKDFKGPNNLRGEYFNLLDLYGRNRIERHLGFFDVDKTFLKYLQGTPKSPLGFGMHWGEEGQKKYAKFFVDHIERLSKTPGV